MWDRRCWIHELTLNMLYCFDNYKRCIHISYLILEFILYRKTKFAVEQPKMLPNLHYQSVDVLVTSGAKTSAGMILT